MRRHFKWNSVCDKITLLKTAQTVYDASVQIDYVLIAIHCSKDCACCNKFS